MTDQDDSFEDPQWTEEARRNLTAKAEALILAVRRHADTVANLTGHRAEIRDIFATHDTLADAVLAYDEALQDFTGTGLPLVSPRGDEEDDVDEETEELDDFADLEDVSNLAVLTRTDYRVADAAAVIAAGRLAYRQVWLKDTDEDAEAEVTDLASALSEIEHARWRDPWQDVEGLRPVRSVTMVVEPDRLLPPTPEELDDAIDPFALPSEAQRLELFREHQFY